ncbi:polysaccharide lyase family 7 protein [Azotobacter chroococcum]
MIDLPQKIDLSHWNLTIPAGAKIIQTKKLQTYASEWFVRNADGSITFFAPSSGDGMKSTTNSAYPRSELRETLPNGDDDEANWSLGSAPVHSLSATLTVDALAKSKKAIIGQFHGKSTKPPFKLQITGDTIYVQYRPKYNGQEIKDPILKGYHLGDMLDYSAEVTSGGAFTVVVNGVTRQYQFDVASYKGDKWYAKAGMYSQEKIGGEGAGRATFYALTMTHGNQKAQTVDLEPVRVQPAALPAAEQPAESEDTTAGIRERLSAMEDLLDDLPEGSVGSCAPRLIRSGRFSE